MPFNSKNSACRPTSFVSPLCWMPNRTSLCMLEPIVQFVPGRPHPPARVERVGVDGEAWNRPDATSLRVLVVAVVAGHERQVVLDLVVDAERRVVVDLFLRLVPASEVLAEGCAGLERCRTVSLATASCASKAAIVGSTVDWNPAAPAMLNTLTDCAARRPPSRTGRCPPRFLGEDGVRLVLRLRNLLHLVVHEAEQLVGQRSRSHDRPAEVAAEVVPAQVDPSAGRGRRCRTCSRSACPCGSCSKKLPV